MTWICDFYAVKLLFRAISLYPPHLQNATSNITQHSIKQKAYVCGRRDLGASYDQIAKALGFLRYY